MANFGFIIDNRKCIGCHACTVACKSEHQVPVGVNRTWVKYIEKGQFPNSQRLFSVMRCNHCDDAPCVQICPVTALFRRRDGIVDFDNRRCIGCKACMQACPYDALYIDPQTRTAAKCNYCAHRVDQGLEPACVNVCPTQAIISGDLDDPNSRISRVRNLNKVTARKTEKGTRPALFYINADVDSLDPLATEQSDQTMWGSQVGGVGHWTEDHPQHALDRLGSLLNLGDHTVMTSETQSKSGHSQRAENLLQSVAPLPRRAYDAPQKGVLWGWQVSSYLWTKAVSAGVVLVLLFAKLFGTYSDLKLEAFGLGLSLVFLGLTGLLLMWDLDQPKRFLYVLLRPQWKSWLVRGAYIITAFAALLTAYFGYRLFSYPPDEQLAWVAGAESAAVIDWIFGLPLLLLAFLAAIYTAFLFAQAKGRDFWQSPTLAIQMLLHSLVAGAASLLLIDTMLLGRQPVGPEIDLLVWCVAVGTLSHLVVAAIELTLTHPSVASKKTVEAIVKGRYQALFWLGVIVAGSLLPLLILVDFWVNWIPDSFDGPAYVMAGIFSLVGVFISQHIWVRAPQQVALS